MIYPIGCVYVQYPQQKSPNELWENTEWSIINYDGVFFRTQGGNASSYIDKDGILKKQEEGLPNITAYVKGLKDNYWDPASGAFGVHNNLDGRARWNDDASNSYADLSFDASRSNSIYGSSNHVIPENYTIRVWKRIR